jgi:hypothetical protein
LDQLWGEATWNKETATCAESWGFFGTGTFGQPGFTRSTQPRLTEGEDFFGLSKANSTTIRKGIIGFVLRVKTRLLVDGMDTQVGCAEGSIRLLMIPFHMTNAC